MIEHGDSKDILGRTYEYCLAKFAEQEGKLAGEFYTPSCVVRTLVEVLQPYNGRVYDPCCGSGGMFVQSSKFIENHGGNIKNISVYGQDSNPTTWKLAQMNLAIRGIEADLGKFNADTFSMTVTHNSRPTSSWQIHLSTFPAGGRTNFWTMCAGNTAHPPPERKLCLVAAHDLAPRPKRANWHGARKWLFVFSVRR